MKHAVLPILLLTLLAACSNTKDVTPPALDASEQPMTEADCVPHASDVRAVSDGAEVSASIGKIVEVVNAEAEVSRQFERLRNELPSDVRGFNAIEYRLCLARARGDITPNQYVGLIAYESENRNRRDGKLARSSLGGEETSLKFTLVSSKFFQTEGETATIDYDTIRGLIAFPTEAKRVFFYAQVRVMPVGKLSEVEWSYVVMKPDGVPFCDNPATIVREAGSVAGLFSECGTDGVWPAGTYTAILLANELEVMRKTYTMS